MAGNSGIFIRCQTQDVGEIISGCKEFLNNIECRAFIKGLVPDSDYGGYKLYFSEDIAVTYFLKEKYLPLSSEQASIHCLTTILAVHDIIPESVDDFKQVLRAQMERLNLKPILGICPIPISPKHPDILSGNWLVEFDIPEIEDLDIFKNIGLPNNMRLQLMIKKNAPDQKKVVTHFCTLCDSTDHSRERCSIIKEQTKAERCPPTFEIRDRTQSNASGSSKTAKQHRIEAIASDLERKKIQSNLCNATIKKEMIENDSSCPDLLLKQEYKCALSPPNDQPKSLKRKMNTGEKDTSKKFYFDTNDRCRDDEDSIIEASATASSTTGKDTPKISLDDKSAFLSTFRTQQNLPTESENSEDDEFSLPNLPTSSQPETSFRRFSTDQTSKDACDSDSNDTPKKPKYVRRKPTYAPVVLPDRIKQIVLSRGLKEGELDEGQLEAFFNHVKKKMCPAKIAERFTANVECLQKQLNAIIQEYYHTPKAGSGEDSRFMKWLEGMLARFDATPTVRKKTKT